MKCAWYPFRRENWVSAWVTGLIVLVVYGFDLPPEIALDSDGIYATAAAHLGIPTPPGYPVWTLYAWSFTRFLPLSTIAKRVSLSSAVAGAAACGLLALLVSHNARGLIRRSLPANHSSVQDQTIWASACGVLAGTGLGFHRTFWALSVRAEPSALAVLILALILCLLYMWFYRTGALCLLALAAFLCGLMAITKLSLAPFVLGLPIILVFRHPAMGRDFSLTLAALLGLLILLERCQLLPTLISGFLHLSALWRLYLGCSVFCALAGLFGAWRVTRKTPFSFRISCICLLPLIGLTAQGLCWIFSLSIPPVNWAYPRSMEGLEHLVRRGQFEEITPCQDLPTFWRTGWLYAAATWWNFGPFLLASAVIGLRAICGGKSLATKWYRALGLIWLLATLLTMFGMNPPRAIEATGVLSYYLVGSHLLLVCYSGAGMGLIGARFQQWLRQLQGVLGQKPQ